MDAQQAFETALPVIAYLISYLIQQQHWPQQVNTIVAGTVVLLAGFIATLLQHRLTSNVLADFLLVTAVSAGLQTEALAPLSKWLKDIGSLTTNNETEKKG